MYNNCYMIIWTKKDLDTKDGCIDRVKNIKISGLMYFTVSM